MREGAAQLQVRMEPFPTAAQQPANHCCTSNAGTAVLPCYQHDIRLELIDHNNFLILYKTSVNHLKKEWLIEEWKTNYKPLDVDSEF